MTTNYIRLLLITLLLILLQTTVFNRFQLFGWGTPYLFIYGLIKLPVGIPRWIILTSSFVLGMLLDYFSNTPGLNAGVLTLAAMLRPMAIALFLPKDIIGSYMPSPQIVGEGPFWRYVIYIVAFHHIVLVFAEMFSFSDPVFMLFRIVFSIASTLFFLVLFEFLVKEKVKR